MEVGEMRTSFNAKELAIWDVADSYNMGFISAKEYYVRVSEIMERKVLAKVLRYVPNCMFDLISK